MEGLIDVLKELYGAENVLEFQSVSSFPETGATGKYYVATDVMRVYQWDNGAYIELLNPDCPYTQFPDAVDTITRKIDIDATIGSVVQQYQNLINLGSYDQAATLLHNNPRLKRVIFGAEDINKLRDGVIAVERTFNTYIAEYIAKLSKPKGLWDSASTYKKYDVVQYVIGADNVTEYFVALPNDETVVDIPSNILPTNTDYWKPITMRGPKGESGSGYTPMGAYDSSQLYHEYDCVVYDDRLWYAIYSGQEGFSGQTPQAGSSYWALFGTYSNNTYYMPIMLSRGAWVSNTDQDSSYFPYKYELTLQNVTANTRADVLFDAGSMDAAMLARLSNVVETGVDTVKFKSQYVPTQNLTGTMSLIQKVTEGPIPYNDYFRAIEDDTTHTIYNIGIDNGEFYIEEAPIQN